MEITHKMTTPDKLREILRIKSWKQKDLAGKLGTSEKTISFWINGKKRPTEVNEEKINTLYRGLFDKAEAHSAAQEVVRESQAKGEIEEAEKVYSPVEKTYYEAKRYVQEMEKENRRFVYLFPSTGKNMDEWYKVGGNSLLLYKSLLAPRLNREAKVRNDTDKAQKFGKGIASVRWGNKLITEAKTLGYGAERIEYGIIVVDLKKDFTTTEIKEMAAAVRSEKSRVKKMVQPKENYPELMTAMNRILQVLPSKVKKLDGVYRDIVGKELLEPMIEMIKIYFRFANGRMEKRDAKLELLERVDDMAAMIHILDECGMLNITARTRLGENVVEIKKEIGAIK